MGSFRVTPRTIADLPAFMKSAEISGEIAREIFKEMVDSGKEPDKIIDERNLTQLSDQEQIERVFDQVQTKTGETLRNAVGQEAIFGFFIGQIMN